MAGSLFSDPSDYSEIESSPSSSERDTYDFMQKLSHMDAAGLEFEDKRRATSKLVALKIEQNVFEGLDIPKTKAIARLEHALNAEDSDESEEGDFDYLLSFKLREEAAFRVSHTADADADLTESESQSTGPNSNRTSIAASEKEPTSKMKSDADDESCAQIEDDASNQSASDCNWSPTPSSKGKLRRKRFSEFICDDCRQSFASPDEFKRHCLETHENQRPFSCAECDKTYTGTAALGRHIRKIHEHEVNVHCDKCQRPFFERSEARKHSKSCKKDKHYLSYLLPCKESGCSDSFEPQILWSRHMKNVHQVLQPYACARCLPKDVRYANKDGLDRHMKNVHQQQRRWKCHI